MPVAEHEAKLERYKARVTEWRDSLEAEISRLADELEAAREELARQGKRCPACGGELACPQCYRGDDF
jgi:uncharacterized protein with PIN domain